MYKQRIEIDKITIKEAIQQRAQLNQACIEDYAEEVANGVKFPPLVVFDVGENLLLADGRHRYEAYRLSNIEEAEVAIYKGTERDAILHAVPGRID